VSWSKKLPEPIRLRNGRELATLSDARSLSSALGNLGRHTRPGTELILKATETGKRADLIDAGHQLARAAQADEILARN
jgi:hypothetical protein